MANDNDDDWQESEIAGVGTISQLTDTPPPRAKKSRKKTANRGRKPVARVRRVAGFLWPKAR